MNTNNPKEYVTLNSGEVNNFSHLNNTMSPQDFNHYGSTTKFSKASTYNARITIKMDQLHNKRIIKMVKFITTVITKNTQKLVN